MAEDKCIPIPSLWLFGHPNRLFLWSKLWQQSKEGSKGVDFPALSEQLAEFGSLRLWRQLLKEFRERKLIEVELLQRGRGRGACQRIWIKLQQSNTINAIERFKELWNERKPQLSPRLSDNKEVNRRVKSEVKRLSEEEFFRRVEAALAFIRTSDFHSRTNPCQAVTLLRHLDNYAERGQNKRGKGMLAAYQELGL